MKKKIVFLTGAGASAESGIRTFRDTDGFWEEYSIEDVCTPEGYNRNPKLVIDFYNERRKQLLTVKPNRCHHTGMVQQWRCSRPEGPHRWPRC